MKAKRIVVGLLVVAAGVLVSILSADAIAVDLPGTSTSEATGILQVETRDERTGQPLAVRVRIVPRSPLREPRVLVDRRGRIRIALRPGVYRVYVSHGPEWSIFARQVEIAARSQSTVRARLARRVDASAYTACDLHVHSAGSPDSDLSVAERVSTLLAEDLQFVVVTDHNRVTDAQSALASAGIGSLPGVEVTTWAPEFGHFNVFPRRTAPRYQGTSPAELLSELGRQHGFVQVNHPRLEHHIGYFSLAGFDRASGRGAEDYPLRFDALEVWNGYDLSAADRRDEIFRDWLALLAQGRRITATGNSDSHRAGRPPYVGYPRTYVRVPRASARASGRVLSALKQGRSFVSNGPLLTLHVRDKEPGETVRLAPGEHALTVRVEVAAPAWMELDQIEVWAGDVRVAVSALPAPPAGAHSQRASIQLEVPVHAAASVLATVRGRGSLEPLVGRAEARPYAFTNPVWLSRR